MMTTMMATGIELPPVADFATEVSRGGEKGKMNLHNYNVLRVVTWYYVLWVCTCVLYHF